MIPNKQPHLSAVETAELDRLESIISDNLMAFYEVGKALLYIRDHKLYRLSHKTFEEYCQDKWGMGRRYVNQLVAASEVVDNLGATAPKLPTNEAQARPLTSLLPDQQREVWQESVETAPDGKVTAKHVKEVVEKMSSGSKDKADKQTVVSRTQEIVTVSDAMSFAAMAISQLERIKDNDPMREAALAEVEAWIKNHRRVVA